MSLDFGFRGIRPIIDVIFSDAIYLKVPKE